VAPELAEDATLADSLAILPAPALIQVLVWDAALAFRVAVLLEVSAAVSLEDLALLHATSVVVLTTMPATARRKL